jgi:hypothetical protein
MGPHRNGGRRALRIATMLCLVTSCVAASAPAAHAATTCHPGNVTANEDDYNSDGVGAFSYSTSGRYLVDAAHGVLANDDGANCLRVDLLQTVDDPGGGPGVDGNLVTTNDNYSVHIYPDGRFTYCAGSFEGPKFATCVPDRSWPQPSGNQTFSGDDWFSYCVWDTFSHVNADCTGNVNITIAPVVQDDKYFLTQSLVPGSSLTVPAPGVLANDSGVDPGFASLSLDTRSAQGGIVTDNGGGGFSYTPPSPFTGFSDSFTYDVFDLDGDNDYTATVTILTDATPPTASITGPHGSVSLSPSFTVSWTGGIDTGGSGFSHYDVEEVGGAWNGTYGAWSGWKMNTTATSASFSGSYGHSYCFRVHAVDNANNTSPWSQTCISVPVKAGSLSYGAGWHKSTSRAYFGGYAMYTTTLNAHASIASVHAKHVWLVTTQSKLSGYVQVQWNGSPVRNINLASSSTAHHKLLLALSFPSPRSGTLTLKALNSGKYVTLEGVDVFLS